MHTSLSGARVEGTGWRRTVRVGPYTMTKRASSAAPRRVLRSRALSHLRTSPLWRTPAKPLTLILVVEALCVTCLVAANVKSGLAAQDWVHFGLLFALSAGFAEGIDRIERLRRYLSDSTGSFMNPVSVWLVAGAIVLPVGGALALAAAVGAHSLVRQHRHQASRLYRAIYSGSTEVLAAGSAALVFALVASDQSLSAPGTLTAAGVLLAVITYSAVNSGLIWAAMWLVAKPDRFRDLLLSADEELLEQATLSLGALLAFAMINAPLVSPLVLVLMVVLRRSALVRQLQEQATRDARTGLLNAGAWRQQADSEVARSARAGGDVSLLMVDLDHFKSINDTHGHQVGDTVLKAVADSLAETLRGYDALGRYGGEEFSALLVDADEITGEAVAERVCARIRDLELPGGLSVSASIGVATAPAARTDLDSLIGRADAALYAAKNQGRDRVRAAGPLGARTSAS
jgi:diguanylate cyclase (GGDEF)-like protein